MWEEQREEMWKYSLRIGGEERRGLPMSESWTVEPHNSNETQKDVRSRSGTGIASKSRCLWCFLWLVVSVAECMRTTGKQDGWTGLVGRAEFYTIMLFWTDDVAMRSVWGVKLAHSRHSMSRSLFYFIQESFAMCWWLVLYKHNSQFLS